MTAAQGAGRFITFEGGEGAGKSTQLRLLADALKDCGRSIVTTREPGGSPGAEEIRQLLVEGTVGRWDAISEALLHFAARRDHVERLIRPALARGDWVLCDRFADSTMAYQGYGHELGREPVATLQQFTIGALAPDLTLILDLPVEAGLARAGIREADGGRAGGDDDGEGAGETRYERMDRAFHERLRAGFLDIARREPGRCVVIDAAQPCARVRAAVRAAVAARLPAAFADASA